MCLLYAMNTTNDMIAGSIVCRSFDESRIIIIYSPHRQQQLKHNNDKPIFSQTTFTVYLMILQIRDVYGNEGWLLNNTHTHEKR
jgi:hypothetical protein